MHSGAKTTREEAREIGFLVWEACFGEGCDWGGRGEEF